MLMKMTQKRSPDGGGGGETRTVDNVYDGLRSNNMAEESQEVTLDEEERAEVLVASWHRWLSDPEIDVLADVPLPGNVQSTRPTKRDVVDREPRAYQQQRRRRGKSDSDTAVFHASDPEFSSTPSPHRKPSYGLESGVARPRRSPMPDVPYERQGTTKYYPMQELSSSSNIPSKRQPLPSRKLSDSEGTPSVERTLPRPTAQSRNRANSLEQQQHHQQRQRIFSDSQLTISSGITEVTRFSSFQHRHNSHAWTKNTHLYMEDGDDNSSGLHHPRSRMFSDSEVTASSWSSTLRGDFPTDTEGAIQFTDLSTPTALGAAKQIASSMGRLLLDAVADTNGSTSAAPMTVAARNLYAATASNSRCRDYYWNEDVGDQDRRTPIASPQGAEVQWSDSADSYADVL
jgi:hypothetical protein